MTGKTLFHASRPARKGLHDKPVFVAILSFACTCTVLGSTLAMFDDASTHAPRTVTRAA